MVSKLRGELETKSGSMDFQLKADTTTQRDKISPSSVNPETGNKATAKIIDSETGSEIGSWWNSCAKKIEIGEEEVIFDQGELKELKKTVLSDGFKVQKIIDEEELDKARIQKEAKHVKPEDETKYALLRVGLQETGKAIVLKHAPSTSENIYALWTDERGMWLSQLTYPDNFGYEPVDTPTLGEDFKEKAKQLILKAEEKHKDTEIVDRQREKLEEAIQKKMKGEELDVEVEQKQEEEKELEEELEAVL
jgi:non-homologous end joining protein Ku